MKNALGVFGPMLLRVCVGVGVGVGVWVCWPSGLSLAGWGFGPSSLRLRDFPRFLTHDDRFDGSGGGDGPVPDLSASHSNETEHEPFERELASVSGA